VAQFFGAFNDNAWKLVVVFLLIRNFLRSAGESGPAPEPVSQSLTTLAFVVFTLPLVLVSLPAGALADRVSKRSLILAMKTVELALMTGAVLVLLLWPAADPLLLVILGLMGVQSALFSPAKYGILPEILPHDRLSAGNGLLEMWTFVAIILGTAAGGLLLDISFGRVWIVGLYLVGFAAAGLWAARRIPKVAPARSEGGMVASVRSAWTAVRSDRVLYLTVAGQVFFWGLVSLLGQEILVFAKAVLEVSDTGSSLLLASMGIGVGAGAWLAGRISGPKVEVGLIPLGALGFCLFSLLLGLAAPRYALHMVLLVGLGLCSGLLIVPLNALLQWRSPADRRGAVIALANVFTFAAILAGSVAAGGLSAAGLSARAILLFASAATVAATAWALSLLPEAFLRLILVLLTHSFYRVRLYGREHLPQDGGALLVPNHVSFADGLFILACTDRPVRFLVDADYFHNPLLRPFVETLGAIPVSASGGPRNILRAFRQAGRCLDAGEIVCIFAEGQITRTGTMQPFQRGLERITKGRSTPVLPVFLDRVWGSIFSRAGGRFVTKWPQRVPYRVTVALGEPVPAGTPVHEIRRRVQDLAAEAWTDRKRNARPLHHRFVSRARRRPWRLAFADRSGRRLREFGAVVGAVALARALRPRWNRQRRVGILLPPGIGGALANLAAALSGRVAINLNYTAGQAGIEAAARLAALETVLTHREFLAALNVKIQDHLRCVWIEEVASEIGRMARLAALLPALMAPVRWLERYCGAVSRPAVDDEITVIFSSGSTGDPKGVILSHFNIESNLEGAAQIFQIGRHDRILGILPFFHSFGTMLLWFAITRGVPIVFHSTPLDAGAIGELVQRYRITILLATPTFLQLYLRRCTPAQFGSLRLVITGAEKLSDRLAQAFEDRFGIRPLEGYGTTECAPIVAASTTDYRAPGFFQPGSRRGFAGQPLPGVTVRVVDPDNFEPLPPGSPGMLLVRGPNVMQGYLGRDDLTERALRNGWYVTGDIGLVDEDGFVKITDRLSRFSKIGGEMVPHGRVEEVLHEAAGADSLVLAVTGIPDERKGERLAVLHTLEESAIPTILERAAARGLPNLFLPRRDQWVRVDHLPLLGTGKLDLRTVKRWARDHLVKSDPEPRF
jgi:acyl-[acyl-carrier-protein]-phospholipid O-acyltransferase/long-chain-fatty-acid--[acyl-carrier-protein] ligase